MFVLLPAMWFLGAGKVVAGDLRGRGLPGLSSKLAGISMVVTVALDFALIPPFGVMGAALASLVAYTVYGATSLVALARVVALPLHELVVPTREDLALYPRALRRLRERARQTPRPA
jgi:Na+-driven multidrug efflux pump